MFSGHARLARSGTVPCAPRMFDRLEVVSHMNSQASELEPELTQSFTNPLPKSPVELSELRQRTLEYLKQVAEVHKGRMTWHLSVFLATVTLTGYGVQTRSHMIFFLTAAVPVFQFLSDYIIKRVVTCPLVYKALMCDLSSEDREPLTLLFLDFLSGPESEFEKLRTVVDDKARRMEFRKMYLRRGMGIKACLFAIVALGELALTFWYR